MLTPEGFAGRMQPVMHRVVDLRRETGDTMTFALEPLDGSIAGSTPGQFNMLWSWGVGEVPISSSAIPGAGLLVHTIRDVGSVTHALCAAGPGTVIGVRGPFGRGWDVDAARDKDVVIVAGGLGLAPLRPVVHALLRERDAYGTVSLVTGARTAADLLFRQELDRWWHEGDIRVRTTVDRPSAGWHGSVGVVTGELPRVDFDPARTMAMVCGPEIMMRVVATRLVERGVPRENILLSLERTMHCGIRQCGHCQLAGSFVCADGPVMTWNVLEPVLGVAEL